MRKDFHNMQSPPLRAAKDLLLHMVDESNKMIEQNKMLVKFFERPGPFCIISVIPPTSESLASPIEVKVKNN